MEERGLSKAFIGGSRDVTRLDAEVKRRLARIVEKGLSVLVGDANGADRAVQRYLSEQHFDKVEVFAADPSPRNNLGGWPVRVISPPHARRDFDYYAAKDRAMAAEATVGLMLWNGESRGTLLNVLRLAASGKPVVVYMSSKKAFVEVRAERDLGTLLAELDGGGRERLRRDIAVEGLPTAMADQRALGLPEARVVAR
jgi:adenine-specific DNA-methyltransferase